MVTLPSLCDSYRSELHSCLNILRHPALIDIVCYTRVCCIVDCFHGVPNKSQTFSTPNFMIGHMCCTTSNRLGQVLK